MIETIKGSEGPEQWRLYLLLVRTILEGKRTSNSKNQKTEHGDGERDSRWKCLMDTTIIGLINIKPTEPTKHFINGTNTQFISSLCGPGTVNFYDKGEAQYCQPVLSRYSMCDSCCSSSSSRVAVVHLM